MIDETKQKNKTGAGLPEEQVTLWNLFLKLGVFGADDLRKELGLDEANFRHLAPTLNPESRRYFIYRVLDEIQKAALCIGDWKDQLSDGMEKMVRIDFERIIDDQHFRARKLSEALVDSVLFSTTNDQEHYADYFHLHELNDCGRSQQDRHEFFGFHNDNARWGGNFIVEQIRNLERAGLDPKTRWYLDPRDRTVKEKWMETGVPFSSFRQKFKQVLSIGLPNEVVALGRSYIHAYGMSRDVHFSPHDTSYSFEAEDVFNAVNKVGFLLLALVIRCQLLMGSVPDGINKEYQEMHDSNTGPAELVNSMEARPAEPGDIVWIQGDYAEVLNVTMSKYGYPAYYVRYIEHAPLSEVPQDWFAGFEIRLVTRKAMIERAAAEGGAEIEKATGKAQTQAEMLDTAKRAVIRLSRIKQQVLAQRATRPQPKSYTPPQQGSAAPNT